MIDANIGETGMIRFFGGVPGVAFISPLKQKKRQV
jgi:hypothetical protein